MKQQTALEEIRRETCVVKETHTQKGSKYQYYAEKYGTRRSLHLKKSAD